MFEGGRIGDQRAINADLTEAQVAEGNKLGWILMNREKWKNKSFPVLCVFAKMSNEPVDQSAWKLVPMKHPYELVNEKGERWKPQKQ